MQMVVISETFGGFGLSQAALDRIKELGADASGYLGKDIPRDDPRLVKVVKEMGDAAGSVYANLVVVEVPDGVKWHIHDYDGYETLHEDHRSWSSDGEEECS